MLLPGLAGGRGQPLATKSTVAWSRVVTVTGKGGTTHFLEGSQRLHPYFTMGARHLGGPALWSPQMPWKLEAQSQAGTWGGWPRGDFTQAREPPGLPALGASAQAPPGQPLPSPRPSWCRLGQLPLVTQTWMRLPGAAPLRFTPASC